MTKQNVQALPECLAFPTYAVQNKYRKTRLALPKVAPRVFKIPLASSKAEIGIIRIQNLEHAL